MNRISSLNDVVSQWELQNQGKNLANYLGKPSWFGEGVYLSYQIKEGWALEKLSFLSRLKLIISKFFGTPFKISQETANSCISDLYEFQQDYLQKNPELYARIKKITIDKLSPAIIIGFSISKTQQTRKLLRLGTEVKTRSQLQEALEIKDEELTTLQNILSLLSAKYEKIESDYELQSQKKSDLSYNIQVLKEQLKTLISEKNSLKSLLDQSNNQLEASKREKIELQEKLNRLSNHDKTIKVPVDSIQIPPSDTSSSSFSDDLQNDDFEIPRQLSFSLSQMEFDHAQYLTAMTQLRNNQCLGLSTFSLYFPLVAKKNPQFNYLLNFIPPNDMNLEAVMHEMTKGSKEKGRWFIPIVLESSFADYKIVKGMDVVSRWAGAPLLVDHIITLVLDFEKSVIEMYDSKGSNGVDDTRVMKCSASVTIKMLVEALQQKFKTLKTNLDTHQTDHFNCGIFILNFIERRLRKQSFEEILLQPLKNPAAVRATIADDLESACNPHKIDDPEEKKSLF